MVTSVSETTARMRGRNDQLRKHRIGGRVVMTRGIAALGNDMIMRIDRAVTAFNAFSPDNDPYGEHDFGTPEVNSPDPTDPHVTCRVMTLMLADEY